MAEIKGAGLILEPYQVIIRPLVTEKGVNRAERCNAYSFEVHKDAIKPGQKVVLVDDLIATGGSAAASIRLIERLGGKVVKVLFVIELKGLKGREKLKGYDVESLISYEGN